MVEITKEQLAAIESRGKVIVSASAGSGKTFVMIEKLTRLIEEGADLDQTLAVTFTKKAAAQMKEKLRKALVARLGTADGGAKAHIKAQISKIPSANISTIHSFCARLLRTYFFAAGIDGGFDILTDEDPLSKDIKERALENVFERLYEEEDKGFYGLLKRFSKKRSDRALKNLVLESYAKIRSVAHYEEKLENYKKLNTDGDFEEIAEGLRRLHAQKYAALDAEVTAFEKDFPPTSAAGVYAKIFSEMHAALAEAAKTDIFSPLPPPARTTKPHDGEGDAAAGELFREFRREFAENYKSVRGDIKSREEERAAYFESCATASAFCALLQAFDAEYAAVKRDENKLDYNDLEHMTLKLLCRKEVRAELDSAYAYVFVDEYQDVNPVQEEIISAIGREVFLVGDVKQAIYGFRGSKSVFFAEKFRSFSNGAGAALRLSGNFRSSGEVLGFVNKLFSEAMRAPTCGFDYAENSCMKMCGGYPDGSGSAGLYIFGKEQKEERELGVYSVREAGLSAAHSREGLAVLNIVRQALCSEHYDLSLGRFVPTRQGDICILTRKNKGGSTEGVIRALRDGGYSVSGEQEPNICDLPEVKNMLDILSLIDNAAQDVPLVSALLSPLGGFCEEELAEIRIYCKRLKRTPFRKCCAEYAANMRDNIAQKLNTFFENLKNLRDFAEILTAGELIDKILADSGLEARYSAGGGEKLKNIRRLSAVGADLPLPAFLAKIKAGDFFVASPAAAGTDSIKVMSMHAAKGLEFPVVIVTDICRTFRGKEGAELPFDEVYGFAPKSYDEEKMLVRQTLLGRLVKLRNDGEELKNELNLFYVACTRAMCKLYVLAEKPAKYSRFGALGALSYSQIFDMSSFPQAEILPCAEPEKPSAQVVFGAEPDQSLSLKIKRVFGKKYAHENSVDLPVKSSASAIISAMREDDAYYAEHSLFGGEGETGAERGTAYHRFLELCDFSAKTLPEVRAQIEKMLSSGKITAAQAGLLDAGELAEILNMPVFADLGGATLYREREFLCRLRAKDVFGGEAEDYVLVQGAIDLMAVGSFGTRIIDYKYSVKPDGELAKIYSPQIALYKKAVSAITKVAEEEIGGAIVNIHLRRQILL